MTGARASGWGEPTPQYFAIPFGVIGLAAAWKTAGTALGAPCWIPPVLLVVAAAAWLAVLAAYLRKLAHRPQVVRSELTGPAASPFLAFAPICLMLIRAGALPVARRPAELVVAVGIALTLGYGAWWTADRLQRGPVRLGEVHSGYLIPVAVGSIEAVGAASAAGRLPLARLCAGAGLLGWAAFGSLTLARLLLRPLPPVPLQPTLVIEAAIAAAAGVACFSVYGARPTGLGYAVAGYGLLLALVQLRLVPRYLGLPFAPGAWVFAFAAAVTATDVLRWLTAARVGSSWPGWTVLAAASVLITWIAAPTVVAFIVTQRDRRLAGPQRGPRRCADGPEGGTPPWMGQA